MDESTKITKESGCLLENERYHSSPTINLALSNGLASRIYGLFPFPLVMVFMVIAIILGLLFNEVRLVLGDIGTATSYDPPYIPTRCNGNSQGQFPPGNLFVAVSDGLWDNGAACGRRYRLRCLSGNNKPCKSGTIDVKVVDFCPKSPCPSTIVLSNDAFSTVSRFPKAKINVEYTQI